MKTIKIKETTWKALNVLKAQMEVKTFSDAIETVLHTAIVEIYEDYFEAKDEEGLKKIKALEKAMGWKYDQSKK